MNNEWWVELRDMKQVAEAQGDGWEIEGCRPGQYFLPWEGEMWRSQDEYRGRPKQPKTKKVTLECWMHRSTGSTCTRKAGFNDDLKYEDRWVRFPAGDMMGEVEA